MEAIELAFQQIKKYYDNGKNQTPVLNEIDIVFTKGKTYAITGVSGTGKSTFMHILAGLDKPNSGKVLYNKKNIESFNSNEKNHFLNTSIGVVFQLPYLIRELSILENVILPGMIGGKNHQDCVKKAITLLEQVNLSDKINSSPITLSGGQQQRVALARALFNEPDFLLADEPTGNLDIKTGKLIVDLLLECHKQWNMGIIVSTHDSYVAQNMQTAFKIESGTLYQI